MKFNVDAAYNTRLKRTGTGVICRNSDGDCKAVMASFTEIDYTPLSAELLAIRECLRLAVRMNVPFVLLESDCLQAIDLIQGKNESWLEVGIWVEDIRDLAKHFSKITFMHVCREGNTLAHQVACSSGLTGLWFSNFPIWLGCESRRVACNGVSFSDTC